MDSPYWKVPLPGVDVQRRLPVENVPGASRTAFRGQPKSVRLQPGIRVRLAPGMLFGISPESCSASPRNAVRLAPEYAGTPINSSNTIKYDGKEYPITGAPWDTSSIKQVDANTLTSTNTQKNGKDNVTNRTVISKDGKTMTTTSKGTNAEGKPVTATLVYDKQ